MARLRKSVFQIHEAAIIYFDAVWRLGSIRAAARKLNVASSAVNRQILKLESAFGTPLFDRVPGGLRLTAGGELFARHTSAVLHDFERASSEIDALSGLRRGHVEIATVEGLCTDFLPDVIEKMRQRHKGITIGVGIYPIPSIPSAIMDGSVHLGLAFEVPRRVELRQLSHSRFRVGAVMRPDHPLATRRRVSLRDCANYPLMVAKTNLAMRQQLEPMLAEQQLMERVAIEGASLELMRQLVLRDMGIAFQTRVGLEKELREGSLVLVPLGDKSSLYQDLGVYVRTKTPLPIAATVFARLVEEEMARRESEDRRRRA